MGGGGGGEGSGPLDPHVRVLCVVWGGEMLRCVWGIHVFLLVMERGGRAYHLLSLNSRIYCHMSKEPFKEKYRILHDYKGMSKSTEGGCGGGGVCVCGGGGGVGGG